MFSIPTVMLSYHRRGFFQMCICFIQEFKVQNQSHRAHYSQGFCQRKNCNTVIFPAAPPSVPAVRGPPQGRSKKVVTSKTHNEHCPAYLAPDQWAVHKLRLQEEGGRWSKKSTFCKLSYHRKCKRRGVGGQKKPNFVNVVCERPPRVSSLQ